MPQLTELRIAGFGGQGVILSAIVIGKAASIFQGAYATMTQNFGPEARGGSCSAQVILSDRPDPLSLCHPAGHHGRDVAGGLHAIRSRTERRRNPDRGAGSGARNEPSRPDPCVQLSCNPARRRTRQAHGSELSHGGIFTAVTQLLEPEAVRQAVVDSVPSTFRDLNLKAFERGYEYGTHSLADNPQAQDLDLIYAKE